MFKHSILMVFKLVKVVRHSNLSDLGLEALTSSASPPRTCRGYLRLEFALKI